ncbi:MAG: hypothetical protein NC095_03640 [Muribaculum sp.]|nr:hypothetical protein [Muribaculum sp.]
MENHHANENQWSSSDKERIATENPLPDMELAGMKALDFMAYYVLSVFGTIDITPKH